MKALVNLMLLLGSSAAAQMTNHVFSPDSYQPSDLVGTDEPFLVFNTRSPSVRYQQVYQNSDFLQRVPGPVQITELRFDTGAGAIDVSLPNVQIDLSTTQKQADGLSTGFSQNLGADDSVVFAGSLHLLT